VELLREMAERTGLVDGVTAALIDTYKGLPLHQPGQVFCDLAAAIADGADAVSGIAVLGDRPELFGPVASMPTAWRVLDRVDAGRLAGVQAARAAARAAAWAAGAGPDLSSELCIDIDATISIAHSEKENAAATFKRTFGFHSLLAFLDRPDISSGEALAGMLRPGNAGSNTAAAAPRGASSYPQLSWEELGGRFLGLMANPDPKGDGDSSMPEKQRSCSGVRSEALRDPRDTAKAILPEPQSPGDARCHPPERRLEPAPCPMPAYQWGRHSLRGADDAQ
jgi:hypothetical protein